METDHLEKNVMGTCLADILLQKNIPYTDTALYQSRIKALENANRSLLIQIDEYQTIIWEMKEKQETVTRSLFERAVQALKAEDYLDALGLLQAVLIHDPENIKAMINLAVVYAEFGYQERAVQMLKAVLEKEPDNKIAKKNLGTLSTN